MVTKKGDKKSEIPGKPKDYHVVDRSYGMFERCVSLAA